MIPTLFRKNRDLSHFFNDFDDIFGNFLVDTQQSTVHFPKVDIHEDEQHLYIDADLPGLDKKDISVSVDNNILSVSGSRTDKTEDKKKGYYRFERHSGDFKRHFQLGDTVDLSNIDASFKNGVLSIQIAKKDKQTAKALDVTIN